MFHKQLYNIIFKKKVFSGGTNLQEQQQPNDHENFRPPTVNNLNNIQHARRIQRSQLAALRFQLRGQPNNQNILNQIKIIEQQLGIRNSNPQEN